VSTINSPGRSAEEPGHNPVPEPARGDALGGDFLPTRGFSVDGIVTKVHDGDTITVRTEFTFNLRLKMSDGTPCYAPELKGDQHLLGLASKEHLLALALGKPVRVFIPTEGIRTLGDICSLGRILGDAWIKGGPQESLAELQLSSGHASKKKK